MLETRPTKSLEELAELKRQYFSLATSALDGMWHFGFAPMSDHFSFYENEKLSGYCCKNSEGYILQFYTLPTLSMPAAELFEAIADQDNPVIGPVKGAFVSTAEPSYLSLCLDNSYSFKVHSLMFKRKPAHEDATGKSLELILATPNQLEEFVTFAALNPGAPEQWLTGYYANLIERKELWGYWSNSNLLASGECRLFDEFQTDYADLGMIVAKDERGKGIATQVLQKLHNISTEQGLLSICSTERSNFGARKAISRAGFESSNRIIQFEFDHK